MEMNLAGLQASLQAGGHAGQVDHVSVDPRSDTIGYQTNAPHTALGGTLVTVPGTGASATGAGDVAARASATSSLSDHLVGFQLASGRGGGEQLSFRSGSELVLHHTGPRTSLSLTLSAFAANGQPLAVRLPPLRVVAGETLRVAPQNWRALGSTPVRVSVTLRGRTTTRFTRGRKKGGRFASVSHATLASLGGGHYRADLDLAVRRAPARGWLSAAATVTRNGRVVVRATPVQLDASALRSGSVRLTLPAVLAAGRYELRVRLLEASADGAIQGSVVVGRTLSVRAR
jgi:hypothetical protein